MNNLDLIRQKCIEANPEIMELKFGCTVLHNDGETLLVVRWNTSNDSLDTVAIGTASPFESYNLYPSEYTVLGRPIRLADCLLAIHEAIIDGQEVEKNTRMNLDVNTSGLFTGNFFDWENDQVYFWNLRLDDLTQQSENTITFLADLLK